jgi:hypothetical protein
MPAAPSSGAVEEKPATVVTEASAELPTKRR